MKAMGGDHDLTNNRDKFRDDRHEICRGGRRNGEARAGRMTSPSKSSLHTGTICGQIVCCEQRQPALRTATQDHLAAHWQKIGFVLRQGACCLTNRPVSNTITIRLPEDLEQWLAEESRVTGLPRGRIVREQLERLRMQKARQPFLDLAGSVEGAPNLSRKRGFRP